MFSFFFIAVIKPRDQGNLQKEGAYSSRGRGVHLSHGGEHRVGRQAAAELTSRSIDRKQRALGGWLEAL